MDEYLNNLRNEMVNLNYSGDYINSCIKYAIELQRNFVPVIFNTNHFLILLGIEIKEFENLLINIEDNYNEFSISSKYKKRKISSPLSLLKEIQKWIQLFILKPVEISEHATAYTIGSSIFKNAIVHTKKDYVVNLDFKNFFLNITYKKVHNVFYSLGYTEELSTLLSHICTLNGSLPQGAPTSPYLSNLICRDLDESLASLCEKNKIAYTRYADDLTFSGSLEVVYALSEIISIIEQQGFEINKEKTKIYHKNQRQQVTGLVVNEKVSVKREFIRELSKEINYCIRFGVAYHMRFNNITRSNYKDHLIGKAYFIKAVDPAVGNKFLRKIEEINWET